MTEDSEQPKPVRFLYPMQEAATQLGIGRTTLYQLISAGEIERVKIGRRSLITAESIEAFVERLKAQNAG